MEKSAELKAKGIDTIACISVNDAFVMKAWKEDLKVNDEVVLLSDGNGDFTKAIGVELDLSDKPVGLGVRSRRYALLAEDGVVKLFNLEEGFVKLWWLSDGKSTLVSNMHRQVMQTKRHKTNPVEF